jgi:O-antigen ligase
MTSPVTWDNRFAAAISTYIAACLLLGGASAAGILANLLLQLVAIGIIWWAVLRLSGSRIEGLTRSAIWLLLATLTLPLLQIIPLPSDIWTSLPGREAIIDDYAQLGIDLPALGISLSPERTIASWLALLPPTAIFLATLSLPEKSRVTMVYAVAAIAFVSILIGFLQVTSKSPSLYPYAITNIGSAVGFFSNRNHLASFLLMSIPLLTLLLRSAGNIDLPRTSLLGRRILVAGCLLILSVGIFFTGSRAGLLLLVPTLGLTYLTMLRTSRGFTPQFLGLGIAGLLIVVVSVMAYSPFYERIVERSENFQNDVRYWTAPISLDTAWQNFPFGTGIGTFDPVFLRAAGDTNLGPNFINHAHNDYLELMMTGGLPAILLILAVMLWGAAVVRSNWQMKSGNPSALSRASSIIIVIVLLHSAVDYPLRTAAIAALFAAACAFQLAPLVPRGSFVEDTTPKPYRRSLGLTDLRVGKRSRKSTSAGHDSVRSSGRYR